MKGIDRRVAMLSVHLAQCAERKWRHGEHSLGPDVQVFVGIRRPPDDNHLKARPPGEPPWGRLVDTASLAHSGLHR